MVKNPSTSRFFLSGMAIPTLLAIVQLGLQITFHENYDYFRDELYYIACSNHLAFGYVDQPPLSIAILGINRMLFGDSLHALRFLPAVAGALVVVLSAMMARKLGGGSFAQGLAALAVVAAPGLIGHGRTFSMNPFDVLFWALALYSVILVLSDQNPKQWVLFGLAVGLGVLNKYSMGFLVIGVVGGLLLTQYRKELATKWFWMGAGVAFLLFLPHVIWEITNSLASLEFMRNASQDKNVYLGAVDFFLGQLRDMNFFNAFLWIGGIYFFFMHEGGRFSPLAWLYPIVFVVMVVGGAKVYYLSPIYPVLLAGGAVLFEQISLKTRKVVRPVFAGLLVLMGLLVLPFAVPVLPVDQFIRYEHLLGISPRADERSAVAELPQYYADQFGWREMVDLIDSAYKKLSPEEQSKCLIYVRNYGEAAAVDFFGPKYGLPNARCAHNNYWIWGPGQQTGDVAIIIGGSRSLEDNLRDLQSRYKSVELAGTMNAKYAMPFENGRMIFICKGMNTTFQKLWPEERFYI